MIKISLKLVTKTSGVIDLTPGVVHFSFYSHLYRDSDDPILIDMYKAGVYSFVINYQFESTVSQLISNFSNPTKFYYSNSYLDFELEHTLETKNKEYNKIVRRLIPYKVEKQNNPNQVHSHTLVIHSLPVYLFDIIHKSRTYFKGITTDSNSEIDTIKLLDICFHNSYVKVYKALDVPTFSYFVQKDTKLNLSTQVKLSTISFYNDCVILPPSSSKLQPILSTSGTTSDNQISISSDNISSKKDEVADIIESINQVDQSLKKSLPEVLERDTIEEKIRNLEAKVRSVQNTVDSTISNINKQIYDSINNVISNTSLSTLSSLNNYFSNVQNLVNTIGTNINVALAFVQNVMNDVNLIRGIVNNILSLPSYISNVVNIPVMIANTLMNLPNQMITRVSSFVSNVDSRIQRLDPRQFVEECYRSNRSIFGNISFPSRYSDNIDLIRLHIPSDYIRDVDTSLNSVLTDISTLHSNILTPYNMLKNYFNDIMMFPTDIQNMIRSLASNIIPQIGYLITPVTSMLSTIRDIVNKIVNLPTRLQLLSNFLNKVYEDKKKAEELQEIIDETENKINNLQLQKKTDSIQNNTVKIDSMIENIVFTFDQEEVENSSKLNKSVPKLKEKKKKIFPSKYTFSFPSFLNYCSTLVPIPLITYRSHVVLQDKKTVVIRNRIYRPGRPADWIVVAPVMNSLAFEKDLQYDISYENPPLNTLVFNTIPIISRGYDPNAMFMIISEDSSKLKELVTKYEYVEIPVVVGKVKSKKVKGKLKPIKTAVYRIPTEKLFNNIPFLDDKDSREILKEKFQRSVLKIYSNEATGYYSNLVGVTVRDYLSSMLFGHVIRMVNNGIHHFQKINLGDVVELRFSNSPYSTYEGKYLVTSIELNVPLVGTGTSTDVNNLSDSSSTMSIELARPITQKMSKEYVPEKNKPSELWNIGNFLVTEN